MAVDLTSLETLLGDLNSLEASEKFFFSETVFLKTFDTLNIKDNYITMGEVRKGNKIPIVKTGGGYGSFPSFDGCALPSCDIATDWSEFTWCLTEIGCEVTICMKDFAPKFLAFFNVYRKMNGDDINTALVQFLVQEFQADHLKAEARVAFFGDTDAVTGEGEDPDPDPLFNGCDGWITQMDAIATANPELKVTITENAAGTVALQTLTDGQDIYNYMEEMYNKAVVQPWFNASTFHWDMNRTLANVLAGWLNTKADLNGINCNCIDVDKVTGPRGFTADNLMIFGAPINVYDFEGMMQAGGNSTYYFDGTKYTKYKNIIILADDSAMMLGYETTEAMSQFNIGWDERLREIFIQGSSLFGAGVAVPEFVIAI